MGIWLLGNRNQRDVDHTIVDLISKTNKKLMACGELVEELMIEWSDPNEGMGLHLKVANTGLKNPQACINVSK